MGDRRFDHALARVASAADATRRIRALDDEDVVEALAALTSEGRPDPYLANVLATEAVNRVRRRASIFETAEEGLMSVGAEGAVTSINPAGARLIHEDRDALVGVTLSEALRQTDADGAARLDLDRILRDHAHVRNVEVELLRRDGTVLPAEVSVAPVVRDGEHDGFVVSFRDTSERRRAEREREDARRRLEDVLDQLPSGVAIAEAPSGRLVYHNAEAVRLLRHPLLESDDYTGYAQYGALHPDGSPFAPEEHPLARALLGGETVREYEMLYRRGDGTFTYFSANAAPVRDAAGNIVAAVSTFHDVTELKRAGRRTAALADASKTLAAAAHDDSSLVDALARTISRHLGDGCVVLLADPASRTFVAASVQHADPKRRAIMTSSLEPIPFGEDAASRVYRTGRPWLVADVSASNDITPRSRALMDRLGVHSIMLSRLAAGEDVFGVVAVARDRTPLRLEADDVDLLQALADRAGLAIAGARLLAAERTARARAERAANQASRLQRLTAALAEPQPTDSVGDVVLRETLPAVGAVAGAVYELDADRGVLRLVASSGYPADAVQKLRDLPLDAKMPLAEAARRGAPAFIATTERLADEGSDLAALRVRLGPHAIAALPLRFGNRIIGGIGFSFGREHLFDSPDREFLETVTGVAAQALARAAADSARDAARGRAHEILESTTDAYIGIDASWRFQYVNARAEALLGTRRDELLGRVVWDAFPQARGTVFESEYERAMSERVAVEFDAYFGPLGTWFDVRAFPTTNGGLAVYFRRAHARHDLAEARFRLLVESVRDYAIFMLDPEGRVATWNKGAERIKGYRADEIIGQSASVFYPPEENDGERLRALMQEALVTGRAEDRGWRVRKNGSRFWADVVITSLGSEDGRPIGFVKVTRDLTEQTRTEEMLAAANRDLTATNRELEAFAYSASHDLRAPLRGIEAMSRMLTEDLSDRMTTEEAEIASRLSAETQRLGRLVDDLLTLSRVGREALRPTDVDVTDIALQVLRDLHAEEPERRVEAAVADGLRVRADAVLTRIAIENLLRNAWKYTRDREAARVEVAADERDDRPGIVVRDNGIGFDPADQARIFAPFTRLANARAFEGTGVGLATVARIAERHGGVVAAEGAPGVGASFFLAL